jgi:MFS superfamily sulfate permease-like transporter
VMVLRTSHSIPFDIRYTIFVMPFACMLLAFGFDRILSQYPKFVVPGYVLIIVVLIVMVAGIFPGLLRKNIPQEKNQFVYHQAAAFLESNANPSDTVIFKTKELAILTNFYFHHELIAIETVDAQSNTGLRIVNGEKQMEFVMPVAN